MFCRHKGIARQQEEKKYGSTNAKASPHICIEQGPTFTNPAPRLGFFIRVASTGCRDLRSYVSCHSVISTEENASFMPLA